MSQNSDASQETPVALTSTVLGAWDELIRRNEGNGLAEKVPPWNVADFSQRLQPIRERLAVALRNHLPDYPQFKGFVVRASDFWGAGPGRARLKTHIWTYLAGDREKTSGRLQVTLSPERAVESEYVAYMVTEKGRRFKIEDISDALQDPEMAQRIKEALSRVPNGFRLRCESGSRRIINAPANSIDDTTWKDLCKSGLSTDQYFVVEISRDRDALVSLTIDELAQMALEDFNDLSEVYSVLEGKPLRRAKATRPGRSPIVSGARMRSTPVPDGIFRPEFIGTTTSYRGASDVVSERYHGVVVAALKEKSESLRKKFGNDILRDGYWLSKDGAIDVLFEVKTKLDRSAIYGAVGQLMLHGAAEKAMPKLVLVVPGTPNEETARYLARLGIKTMPYELDGGEPIFKTFGAIARECD